jgi:hypothetical protein
MTALIFVLVAGFVCVVGWIYGEMENKRSLRITFAILTVIVFSGIAAGVSGINTAMSIGIPVSKAVHAYLDASSDQLLAGHIDFVIAEFDAFQERAHVTYETGGFIEAVQRETNRMRKGPAGS